MCVCSNTRFLAEDMTETDGVEPLASSVCPGRFAGRIVLVTGGTSGIGEAAARRFHAEGASVAISGRNAEKGERVAASLNSIREGSCLFVVCDHSTRAGCEACVKAVVARFGTIDVLFNNAGIVITETMEDTSPEVFRKLQETNVNSVFDMSQLALPYLRKKSKKRSKGSRNGGGVIINNASDWGIIGADCALGYCVSKASIVMMTKCLGLEEASNGVRVCAVCPGNTFVERWVQEARETGDFPPACSDAEIRQCLKTDSSLPLGRPALPREIAAVVCFLASDDASYMTACAVPVDGGVTAS